MSLIDLGIECALSVPDSPEQLAQDNPELADFLNELDRPIGLIPPDKAAHFVLAAELTPALLDVRTTLGQVAAEHSQVQRHKYNARITKGTTEFGDVSFSAQATHSLDRVGHHSANNLIFVEGKFLFGHSHIFRNVFRPNKIELVEINVKPLDHARLDKFNAIVHRSGYQRH